MEYVSAKEAAEKWHVNIRVVQDYCKNDRIPGAKKYGVSWMIPACAVKPSDPRKERKLPREERASFVFYAYVDLPKGCPEDALPGIDAALRPLAQADITFRRGDPESAKAVWRETPREDKIKLSTASLATAAAISSGDYALYGEIQAYLLEQIALAQTERDRALLSLPGVTAEVSMAVPSLSPDWLRQCDFSAFPRELRPFLLYLYALHLRNIGDYGAVLAVGEATLALCERPLSFTWLDAYLGVLCASAAYAQGDVARAKRRLDFAMDIGMPSGFIAPFADYLGDFGGMLEAEVERKYPQYRRAVIELWGRSFKNWIQFHNLFAKEHITTILSPREYQAARLIAGGATYASAARSMSLSVSRVKNIMAEVYAKLCVRGRQDLGSFIL